MLKGENLIKLLFKLANESLLVVLCPCSPRWVGVILRWLSLEGCFQAVLEIVVGDIGVVVVLDKGGTKLVTEPKRLNNVSSVP